MDNLLLLMDLFFLVYPNHSNKRPLLVVLETGWIRNFEIFNNIIIINNNNDNKKPDHQQTKAVENRQIVF